MYQIISLIDFIGWLLNLALLARVILSWIPHDPYQPFVQFIYRVTEPILEPFRKLALKSSSQMGIDFSPMLAILTIWLIRRVLVRFLLWL